MSISPHENSLQDAALCIVHTDVRLSDNESEFKTIVIFVSRSDDCRVVHTAAVEFDCSNCARIQETWIYRVTLLLPLFGRWRINKPTFELSRAN
jgi:hypothetical protein